MKPYCEIVAQIILPNIRALVAKELMEKYGFTQQAAAKKLGLTQSAISQYLRNLRGSQTNVLEKDEKISKLIEDFAGKLASGEMDSCKTVEAFCTLCKELRKSKILCKLHKDAFPELENCNICTC
ncbi:MAG: helix-turn-helix domain-containing protein [Candidatus Aenigmarchaeota archaeon]|nr:helix-turn-helix domain-containing protein [Candidatus Aenigmarchaeota archaeon]